MARALYGGRLADSVASLMNLGKRQVLTLPVDTNGDPTTVTLTVWDAPGGEQLVDLLAADAATAITSVVVPRDGQIPEFYGPDGLLLALYLRDPEGDFYRIDSRPDVLAGAVLEAGETAAQAATDAEAAAAAAQAAVDDIVGLQGTQGLALDTDGVPYFDPALNNVAPTLALLTDTDGVPYLVGA